MAARGPQKQERRHRGVGAQGRRFGRIPRAVCVVRSARGTGIACPAAQSARTLAGSRARAGELEGAASRSPGPAPAVAVRDLARPVVQSAATGGAPGVVVRGIGGVEAGSVVLALQPCHTPEERDQALVQQLKPTLSHESRARVMSERSAMAVQDRFEIPGMSRGQLSAPNLEEPACPGPARQGG